jgi:nitrate/nitrite-specific signal transduction histidine kinase
MGEGWVEIVKNVLVIVGIPAALAGAWKALRELALGTREKARENRIRQALAARDC